MSRVEHLPTGPTRVAEESGPAEGRSARRRPAWVAPALVGAGALGACAAVAAIDPVEPGNPEVCPFKILTGLDCPGCGASRATNALLRGNLGAAVDHNLLFVVLAPVAVVAYALWAARSLGWSAPALRPTRAGLAVIVGAVLAFWALRVLPWEPFTWLASGRW